MSMCLRQTLESYIRSQQSNILRHLMKIKKQALIELEEELISGVNSLEGAITSLTPQISDYKNPEDYVKALKAYAITYSYISSIMEANLDTALRIEIATKIASTIKAAKGTDMQTIIETARNEFNMVDPTEYKRYTEATRRYLATLIQNCGSDSLDIIDQQILKQTIVEIVVEEEKPYITTEELGARIGIDRKKVEKIIEETSKIYSDIIIAKNIVTTEEKILNWIRERRERREDLEMLKRYFPKQLEKVYYQSVEESLQKLRNLITA